VRPHWSKTRHAAGSERAHPERRDLEGASHPFVEYMATEASSITAPTTTRTGDCATGVGTAGGARNRLAQLGRQRHDPHRDVLPVGVALRGPAQHYTNIMDPNFKAVVDRSLGVALRPDGEFDSPHLHHSSSRVDEQHTAEHDPAGRSARSQYLPPDKDLLQGEVDGTLVRQDENRAVLEDEGAVDGRVGQRIRGRTETVPVSGRRPRPGHRAAAPVRAAEQ